MTIKLLKHRPGLANSEWYGEPGPERQGRVFCCVLTITICKVDGEIRRKHVPEYYFTVYRRGTGRIGSFTYRPKQRPNPIALSERTATRQVREFLNGLEKVA